MSYYNPFERQPIGGFCHPQKPSNLNLRSSAQVPAYPVSTPDTLILTPDLRMIDDEGGVMFSLTSSPVPSEFSPRNKQFARSTLTRIVNTDFNDDSDDEYSYGSSPNDTEYTGPEIWEADRETFYKHVNEAKRASHQAKKSAQQQAKQFTTQALPSPKTPKAWGRLSVYGPNIDNAVCRTEVQASRTVNRSASERSPRNVCAKNYKSLTLDQDRLESSNRAQAMACQRRVSLHQTRASRRLSVPVVKRTLQTPARGNFSFADDEDTDFEDIESEDDECVSLEADTSSVISEACSMTKDDEFELLALQQQQLMAYHQAQLDQIKMKRVQHVKTIAPINVSVVKNSERSLASPLPVSHYENNPTQWGITKRESQMSGTSEVATPRVVITSAKAVSNDVKPIVEALEPASPKRSMVHTWISNFTPKKQEVESSKLSKKRSRIFSRKPKASCDSQMWI